MSKTWRISCGLGLVALGYLFGVSGVFTPSSLTAQDDPSGISDESLDNIKAANEAITTAQRTLEGEQRYIPAIKGMNSFATMVGGVDAVTDLENGQGVDPETFAALYAGLATDEVAQHLSKDDQGRLTYKNKLIRMYPISRLKRLFVLRDQLGGLKEE